MALVRRRFGMGETVSIPRSSADMSWAGSTDFPFTGDSLDAFKRCMAATNNDGIYCAAQVAAAYASQDQEVAPGVSVPAWLLPAGLAFIGALVLFGGRR